MRSLQTLLAHITYTCKLDWLWYPMYRFIYIRFKNRLPKALKNSVHSRNSFKEGRIVPPLSDIDITILLKSEEEIKSYLPYIKRAMDQSLLVKEINLIAKDNLKDFIGMANSIELTQDPCLMNYSKGEHSEVDKLCYLLRQVRSDVKNLNSIPKLRLKKWSNAFSKCSVKIKSSNEIWPTLVNLISKYSNKDKTKVENLLRNHLNYSLETIDLAFLFPVEFLSFTFSDHHIEYEIKELDQNLQNIYLRVVDNEIWGLFTQLPFYKHFKQNELVGHLNNIDNLSRKLCNDHYYDKIQSNLNLLKEKVLND